MFAAIDNWLFLILVGVAALFRLLSKAAESKSGTDTPDETTFPPADQNQARPAARPNDEEQIRKFLEALGQPRTSNVPPPVVPRTDVPPRPVAPVRPPPGPVPSPEWLGKRKSERRRVTPRQAREQVPPPLPSQSLEPEARSSRTFEAPVFEVHKTTALLPEDSASRVGAEAVKDSRRSEAGTADLIRSLRTPQGLRQAIILREIFGQPRSLRPLEDLPGTA
jgi:hypothetical protein